MRRALFLLLMLAPAGLHAQSTGAAGSPEVTPLDAAGLQHLRESERGNVVLINFWATWCAPCVAEFPDLLKLRREYGPKGLTVIFVSIDRPTEAATSLTRFLRSRGVTFTTYIKKAGDDEAFINSVSTKWSGALPATFIYDKTGKLVHFLLEAQSLETFTRHVQPLLAR
jgi:thiol-disulfide isomerase/thioredoxin